LGNNFENFISEYFWEYYWELALGLWRLALGAASGTTFGE